MTSPRFTVEKTLHGDINDTHGRNYAANNQNGIGDGANVTHDDDDQLFTPQRKKGNKIYVLANCKLNAKINNPVIF